MGAWILMLVGATSALGQIWVPIQPGPVPMPRPIVAPDPQPSQYSIKELEVAARIRDQVAEVRLAQTFKNTGSQVMEVVFVFPLPHDATIDQLTFMVNGTEFAGELLSADEARTIFEGYVRRNKDPALLEWVGHGMFRTSVFPVPAGEERTVTLRYTQLLDKEHNLTDFIFPLSTAKYTSHALERVSVRVSIESSSELKNIYSPTHPVEVLRSGAHNAVITYEVDNQVPISDFRLFYDVAEGPLAASVISYRPDDGEDGFFIMLATPELNGPQTALLSKTVVFVIDRSGSMSGKKMEQAREAAIFVLNNLREGDLFNIVVYDNQTESFAPELQRYDEDSRARALGFVRGLSAGGGTNIDEALTTAMDMIQDESQPNYIVFLTDGMPTTGETDEMRIVTNARESNDLRARLITFGVGFDVNARLLERLIHANFGQSEYVRPDEDIEEYVAKLYNKISSPVLSNVEVAIEFDRQRNTEEGPAVSRIYPREVYDLFEGEQMVLVGRYRQEGAARITITGNVRGEEQTFSFPATFVEQSSDESFGFVARLWATRRIGEIVDEIDLNGQNEELLDELVALSTKFGILTPYTSFLADDQPGVTQLTDRADAIEESEQALEALTETSGRSAFAQRSVNNALQSSGCPSRAGASYGADGRLVGLGGGANYHCLETDKVIFVDTVQIVGNEAMYCRGNVWFAANTAGVDLEEQADDIALVERFTNEYFALIAANTPSENALLARQLEGEELVLRLRNQVYRIQ